MKLGFTASPPVGASLLAIETPKNAPAATKTTSSGVTDIQPPNLATRRWWYIMPSVFITYSLAYLDRANFGFAAMATVFI